MGTFAQNVRKLVKNFNFRNIIEQLFFHIQTKDSKRKSPVHKFPVVVVVEISYVLRKSEKKLCSIN